MGGDGSLPDVGKPGSAVRRQIPAIRKAEASSPGPALAPPWRILGCCWSPACSPWKCDEVTCKRGTSPQPLSGLTRRRGLPARRCAVGDAVAPLSSLQSAETNFKIHPRKYRALKLVSLRACEAGHFDGRRKRSAVISLLQTTPFTRRRAAGANKTETRKSPARAGLRDQAIRLITSCRQRRDRRALDAAGVQPACSARTSGRDK